MIMLMVINIIVIIIILIHVSVIISTPYPNLVDYWVIVENTLNTNSTFAFMILSQDTWRKNKRL